MRSNDPRHDQERRDTDASLEEERAQTDEKLRASVSTDEANSDVALARSRQLADQRVAATRRAADARADSTQLPLTARDMLRDSRRAEDAAVSVERRVADETLNSERVERRLRLASFLAAERAATDLHLGLERRASDSRVVSREDYMQFVAHDAQNLLLALALSAEQLMLESNVDDPGELRRRTLGTAQRVQQGVAQLRRLVADLVNVTRIEMGTLVVDPKPHEARQVVRDALELLVPLARERDIAVTASTDGPPVVALMDVDRILQVLGNLLGNALKFTPAGGRITVNVIDDGSQVHISVEDTGAGIPPEQQALVFERFWKADVNDPRGQGIGLFISKSIIEAHGGQLRIESAVGKGSRFSFNLSRVTS